MLQNAFGTMQEVMSNIVDSKSPMDIMQGKVIAVKPLKISIGNSYVLEENDLQLSPLVQDMNVPVSFTADTSATEERHKHKGVFVESGIDYIYETSEESVVENGQMVVPPGPFYPGPGSQPSTERGSLSHFHITTGTFDMVFHFGLAVNDYVVMLKYKGGQRYLVLFKIQGAAEESE